MTRRVTLSVSKTPRSSLSFTTVNRCSRPATTNTMQYTDLLRHLAANIWDKLRMSSIRQTVTAATSHFQASMQMTYRLFGTIRNGTITTQLVTSKRSATLLMVEVGRIATNTMQRV